ncbi:MAG: protein kinase family protein [Candidatus Eisenbacteria bacterium]
MLAGQPPFTGPTGESLVHQHLTVEPRSVADLRLSVPAGIARAVARALAKPPADRFGTLTAFAEALGTQESSAVAAATTVVMHPVPRPWRLVRGRRALAAAAVVALAVAAFVAWEERDKLGALFGGPTTTQAMKKDWILVAAFEGPANDSSLAVAVRLLVSAALDQSAIVATVPDDQIRLALEQAGKPPGTHVDAALARELAYRRAIRAVVEGHVSRLGEGYSVLVRVLDADSVRVLATVSEAARSDDELIPTVGRVARRLRDALGERRQDLRATRPLQEMMTPSFEAYRRNVKAEELFFARDARGAIAMSRSALALDPDFVGAWTTIGFAFGSIGEPDSALAALDEALRRPRRVAEAGRFLNKAMVAYFRGDMQAAFEAIDQALRHDPAYYYAHNSRGLFLGRMGRREEALSAYRRAAELQAVGASQTVLRNQMIIHLELGRVAEARELARHSKGRFAQIAPGDIAVAAGDWAAAESLGRAVERDPEAPADERAMATSWAAVGQAASGRVSAAAQSLGRGQKRTRLLLEVVSGRLNGVPEDVASSETTAVALVTEGLWEAAAGDTARARRLLARVRTRSALEQNRLGSDPILIEAWIATRARRFGETVRILGPSARQGDDLGFVLIGSNRVLKRWLVAEAYENLGRPDSAAVYFELAMSPIGKLAATTHARIAYSYAHRRLVLLDLRMGRVEEARRHWDLFSATFTRPDPEMLPLIEEARAALVSAEAMARGQQR